MVVLTVPERDLPHVRCFMALSTKLQASVTNSANIIPEDVANMMRHTIV